MYPNKGWASTQPYEYSDYNSSDEQSPTFDSYTIPEDDLELGQSRLLEVDNRQILFQGHHPFITHLANDRTGACLEESLEARTGHLLSSTGGNL